MSPQVNNPKVSLSPARETNQDVSGLQLADQSNPVPKLAPVLPLPTVPAVQLTNQITAPEPIQHIPQMPVLATPTLDTSQLTQLIQTNQSDLSSALSCLQSGVSGAAQSVAELSLSMSAVVTHSSQSNAAISNLTQVCNYWRDNLSICYSISCYCATCATWDNCCNRTTACLSSVCCYEIPNVFHFTLLSNQIPP